MCEIYNYFLQGIFQSVIPYPLLGGPQVQKGIFPYTLLGRCWERKGSLYPPVVVIGGTLISREAARMSNLKAARAKLKWYRRYYAKHGKGICPSRKSRYALAEPKGSVIEVHEKKIQHQLLANAGAKLELVEAFKKQSKTAAKQLPKSMVKTVCVIAAKRLCNKALQIRKEHVGTLLKTTRAVQNLKIKGRDDFGEGCHTIASA